MRFRLAALTVLLMLGGMLIPSDVSAIVPRPTQKPRTWQLDFEFHDLQAIRASVPGQAARTYWYIRYKAINRTGDDRPLNLSASLYSETGKLMRANRDVPFQVYTAVKKLHNDPLLQWTPLGKILQGEDNAERGVFIWPDFDPKAGTVDIFIEGLSGDTVTLKLPTPIKKTVPAGRGKTKEVVQKTIQLKKTLHLQYTVVGDAETRHQNDPTRTRSRWIMR